MQPNVEMGPHGMLQEQTPLGKLDHRIAENAFQNVSHGLGDASICLHDDAGPDGAECEPQLLMESMDLPLGMVVKFHECAINGPKLPVSSPQNIARNHLVGVQLQTPWHVGGRWLLEMFSMQEACKGGALPVECA